MSDNANLFERCGGIRPMAGIVDEAPSTVQSWKDAGRIPATKQPKVLEKVAAAGIRIVPEDVIWPLGKDAERSAPSVEAV